MELMIEKMLAAFELLHPLTDDIKQRLTGITHVQLFPQKHLLLREGETSIHAYFVFKGLARAYYIADGKEITSRFMDEGFIITLRSPFILSSLGTSLSKHSKTLPRVGILPRPSTAIQRGSRIQYYWPETN